MRAVLVFLIFLKSALLCAQQQFTFALEIPPNPTITCTQTFVVFNVYSAMQPSAPVTWSWTNGVTSTVGSIVGFTATGNYSVFGVVGANTTWTTPFTITSDLIPPTSTLSAVLQTVSCTAPVTPVTATLGVGGNRSYFVSPVGGTLSVDGSSPSYVPGVPGTYTHIAIDTVNGCRVQKTFSVVSSSFFPTFSLTSQQNFILGCVTRSLVSVNIVNAVSNPTGMPLSYTVTSNSSFTTAPVAIYSFTQPGTYTAVVKDDNSGCTSKVPFSVLPPEAVPRPGYIPLPVFFNCDHTSATYTLFQQTPGSYSFGFAPFNPGSPLAVNHPYDTLTIFSTANPTNTGFFPPFAVITDLNSECFFGISALVSVDFAIPTATVYASPPDITCTHPKVLLTVKGKSGNPLAPVTTVVAATLWQGPSQSSSTLSSGYLAGTSGIYTVTVKDQTNGCMTTTYIMVNDLRSTPQISVPALPSELCITPVVTLQPVNISTVSLSYNWPSVGSGTVAGNGAQLTTGVPGVYTVIATDPSNGCAVAAQFTVQICSGIEEFGSFSQTKIFPNPFSDYFFIQTQNPVFVSVINIEGKKIVSRSVSGPDKIDLSELARGVYLIAIERNGETRTMKLIKE
jgi:hypothetical protein